jgi:DNA-binding transcriptional regulator LsrR (DeoR family)
MEEKKISLDRIELLADIAEMYYKQGKTQEEIANKVGVTRSMISRMLTDAHKLGLVEINIHRPLAPDPKLADQLKRIFKLKESFVFNRTREEGARYTRQLGQAGATIFGKYLKPGMIIGIAWGVAVSSTVDALVINKQVHVKIVQLVGAINANIQNDDGHSITLRLVEKTGGEGYYLNAPFFVDSQTTVRALLENISIRETINLAKKSDVALMGIGCTDPRYASAYVAEYLSFEELSSLCAENSVGFACGFTYDLHGRPSSQEFNDRLVSIERNDLFNIPIRIGVAGGIGKLNSILGAIRGGYVNVLVTDNEVAGELIRQGF